MAVKLRLRRMGKKKQPIYKVVAADSRSPRDGKFLESIGLYNPLTNPSTIEIKEDRAMYWLDNGAQPTDTVKNLLSKQGILLKRDLKKRGASDDKIEAELGNWKKLQEAKASSNKAAKATAKPAPQEAKKAEEKVSEDVANEGTTEASGAALDENTEKTEE